MNRDLYFIPLIERALREHDPKAALVQAFQRIRELAQLQQYRRGYREFLLFMASAYDARELGAPGEQDYRALGFPTPEVEFHLFRQRECIAKCIFDRVRGSAVVEGIRPGSYRLALASGRIIWEAELTEKDVSWSAAYPAKPVQLAADSGETTQRPTREIRLLEGTVILRLYPGLDRGTLVIEVRGPEV